MILIGTIGVIFLHGFISCWGEQERATAVTCLLLAGVGFITIPWAFIHFDITLPLSGYAWHLFILILSAYMLKKSGTLFDEF